MSIRIAAITMVKDEGWMLQKWRSYYGEQLGKNNIFIIDDNSEDCSTDNLYNIVRLPATQFSDFQRANLISHFASGLLNYFDWVIYADCDEFIAVDPEKHGSLRDYLNVVDRGSVITPAGLNLIHLKDTEPALSKEYDILSQRRHAQLSGPMCKPVITSIDIKWSGGFHSCSRPHKFDENIVLFHLRDVDFQEAIIRKRSREKTVFLAQHMNEISHWKVSQETFVQRFRRYSELPVLDASEFYGEIQKFTERQIQHEKYGDNGIYFFEEKLSGHELLEIPKEFEKLF